MCDTESILLFRSFQWTLWQFKDIFKAPVKNTNLLCALNTTHSKLQPEHLEYGTACAVKGVALRLSKKLGTSSILSISHVSQEEGWG